MITTNGVRAYMNIGVHVSVTILENLIIYFLANKFMFMNLVHQNYVIWI